MATAVAHGAWTADLERPARALGKVAVAGAVSGVVIGGVGGRLAMFLLRVTSSPALRGVETDDGFTIGELSSATVFLLGVTAFLGLAGALVYAAVRVWFPPGSRPWISGAVFGLAGGAGFVQTEGIDFRMLAPLWLAIVLFVALPTIYGVVVSLWIEHSLGRERSTDSKTLTYLPLAAFLVAGPFGLILLVLLFAGWAIGRAAPWIIRIWRSAAVTWIGRIAIGAVVVMSVAELAGDIDFILGRM